MFSLDTLEFFTQNPLYSSREAQTLNLVEKYLCFSEFSYTNHLKKYDTNEGSTRSKGFDIQSCLNIFQIH